MNREIKALYTIFDIELAPPFTFRRGVYFYSIINRYSDDVGYYSSETKKFHVSDEKSALIIKKVKQLFNIDGALYDDVDIITKHLFDWLRDKQLSKKVIGVTMVEDVTNYFATYLEDDE